MDTYPEWKVSLLQAAGELVLALVALPLYVLLVLPKHGEGALPGFSPIIAEGVNPFLAVALALAVFAAGIGLGIVLVLLFGRDRVITDEVDHLANDYSLIELVPGFAAAGFAEEFLFRVVCVDLCGVIIASILFMAAHFSYWKHPLPMASVFILGLLLGCFYVFTQSLLLCALVHFAYNMVITHLLKSGFITRVSAGRKSA